MTDGSGECIVDPAGASIVALRVDHYRDARQAWTERVILPQDPLCVIGEFSTSAAEVSEEEIEYRVGKLIAEWKKDLRALIKRFDLNGDGQFSAQEWDLVRAAARREVKADIAVQRLKPQNLLSKPRDARPFLVAAQDSGQFRRDLAIWAWLQLALLLLGAAAGAWILVYA
jgi:hypothetical protein